MNVYISIGNSDDKLTQHQWSQYVLEVITMAVSLGHVHGSWASNSLVAWQNACWCVEYPSEAAAETAKDELRALARKYGQDSIAWAVAPETEFLK
jgi:hypothetical protein